MKLADLYEKDFYRWAMENADLLSAGDVAGADLAHIAEEIRGESFSRSFIEVARARLIFWLRSWRTTKLNQRHEIGALLDEMPSLRKTIEEALPKACKRATEMAAAETGLPRTSFPKECPFTARQLVDTRFWPR
jgi:hypothetical protein